MDKTGLHPGAEHAHAHAHDDSHHEELGFWRKYVFSVDHKVIGIQYTITALLFLLFGFTLMMIMRWQLAYPGRPIPLIGMWLGQDRAPMGIMSSPPTSATMAPRCERRDGSAIRCRAGNAVTAGGGANRQP